MYNPKQNLKLDLCFFWNWLSPLNNKLKRVIQTKDVAPQAAQCLAPEVALQSTLTIWTQDLLPDHHSAKPKTRWEIQTLCVRGLTVREARGRGEAEMPNEPGG